MFTIVCTLLSSPLWAECNCRKNAATCHCKIAKEDQQEITVVIPATMQCEEFKDKGRKANKLIAAAYHHDDVESGKQTEHIFVSGATIESKDKQTTLRFFVSKKVKKEDVEKKVRKGFEEMCTAEKAHMTTPKEEHRHIKCWICHEYGKFTKWIKGKWHGKKEHAKETATAERSA